MNATTARRGFTLIEILIAATVLGLGVLGIAALFAGAARQQQIAFDQSSTQRVTNNIDALLSDRFERFGGAALVRDDDAAGSFPYFAPGQWHPLASVPFGGVAGQRLPGTLSLDRSDNDMADQTAYGLARGDDLVLYRAPWTVASDIPAEAWSQPMRQNPLTGMPPDNPMPTTVDEIDDLQGVFNGDAPWGSLQPGFIIRARFAWERQRINEMGMAEWILLNMDEDDSEDEQPMLDFAYLDWNNVGLAQSDPEFWPERDDEDMRPTMLPRDSIRLVVADESEGTPPSVDMPGLGSGDSWLELKVPEPGTDDSPEASLVNGEIQMPGYNDDGGRAIVREIRLVDPLYREDRLLSMDERLGYTDDAAFPGGRRPSRGVAVLYRRTLDGRDQLLTISYTLEPLGRVQFNPQTEVPFVPPDTFERLDEDMSQDPSDYGLLSQVELELGFDTATEEYTLTALNEEDEWAVERGQIVVVARKDDSVDPEAADRDEDLDPGAEFPVRVTGTRRDGSDRLVAVLDDSPRVSPARGGLRSMLDDREMSERVWAWALRDVVRSAAGGDEDVDWRVRPSGARVVTLGGLR